MEAATIRKYSKLTIPVLVKKARTYFNEYIRLRDSDANGSFICISCGVMKSKPMINAGHFHSAGNNSIVRFNEDNCHAQCIKCNLHLHGNLLPYQKNLIKKIGQADFNKLEIDMLIGKRFFKWDMYALIEIIETYKVKVKELRKTKNY